MVARLRPFSTVSHCTYSLTRASGAVIDPEVVTQPNCQRGVIDVVAAQQSADLLAGEPEDLGGVLFGPVGHAILESEIAGLEDVHHLIRPTRRDVDLGDLLPRGRSDAH